MSEYTDLIQRNSHAIDLLARSYQQLRQMGVESFLLTAVPNAVEKLAKQIEVQCDAEVAVRKP